MQRIGDRFIYSASDLNDALECPHLLELERLVALGSAAHPEPDPATELLAQKGDEHEARHLERLQAEHGRGVVVFPPQTERTVEAFAEAECRTVAAMAAGARIVYQGTFFDGSLDGTEPCFLGRTDFLRRVERPCARWAWSYEVIDTKLALSPKPYYLIQLSSYSEHVTRVQGTPPEFMHVVLGNGRERSFRVDEYDAYYRRVKQRFLERMDTAPNDTYPLEVTHCGICRWRDECAARRDADDHLSLVAGMRNDQRRKLESSGITTLAALAAASEEKRPRGMKIASFRKLHEQAKLQHEARSGNGRRYEFLAHDDEHESGFRLLPAPDEGDLFFDMEGDPLYHPDRGLEYLFGVYAPHEDRYVDFWATDPSRERAAFEAFVDFVSERLQRYPNSHVYHYAAYEIVALKRLAGRFGSREEELDAFLRRELFVDLYAVVRQSLRISQPSYSLKKLEAFYNLERRTKTKRGDDSIVMFETWLETGDQSLLDDIRQYNDDDCRSTHALREWLLTLREEFNALLREKGKIEIPFRAIRAAKDPDRTELTELERRLLAGIVDFESEDDLRAAAPELRARWLLGHLLQYHRRDQKPQWWKYFHRVTHPDELEEHDGEAIGDLRYRDDVPPALAGAGKRRLIYTYEFPEQEYRIGRRPVCPYTEKSAGEIVELDADRRLLRIELSRTLDPARLRALIPGKPIPDGKKRLGIERIATSFLDGDLRARFPATAAILYAERPVLLQAAHAISERIAALDGSYLPIQGPPGSGKSTTAAHAIVDLLRTGKRVGIAAINHKALHHLLGKIELLARERGVAFRGVHKYSEQTDGSVYEPRASTSAIENVHDAESMLQADLASGTTFAWASPILASAFDVLFIEEAGQVSLADALVTSTAARNVVLLGDPLQLAHVSQGSHPAGTANSVLQHVLGAQRTVAPDRGIFLERSYRMHPEICAFISQTVYEGRLLPDARCADNAIESPGLHGSGLRFLPVEHEANGRGSPEEAVIIAQEIELLLQGRCAVNGEPARRIRQHDILVVAPYNVQRLTIERLLRCRGMIGVRVGTVDKFQGQEAPVVFYSMATSSAEYLPRDVNFLFDLNRFNVAISRAECMSVLVCSPALLDTRCEQPEQMRLVNLLCRFVEAATQVKASASFEQPAADTEASGY
jgi:predicted RecB family nuclease